MSYPISVDRMMKTSKLGNVLREREPFLIKFGASQKKKTTSATSKTESRAEIHRSRPIKLKLKRGEC